jgi:hypothetical protein
MLIRNKNVKPTKFLMALKKKKTPITLVDVHGCSGD